MRYLSLFTIIVAAGACGDEKVPASLDSQDVNVTTAEDTPISITVPVSSNRPLVKVTLSTMPTHGTVTASNNDTLYTYTPAANYNGTDTLAVTFDNGTETATGTAHITITPVDDAPVAGNDNFAGKFNLPTTFDDATLLMNDTDIDSTTLTITSVTPIAHGTPTHAGTSVTFTPDNNFQGVATFNYTVSDGTLSAVGTVTVTIGANAAPVAVDDTVAGVEDTVLTIPAATLLANDSDADHQILAIAQVNGTANTHGTVSLSSQTITYTPDANFNGPATFTYGVTDGADISTATVTVNVAPVNDPPSVPDVGPLTVAEDTALAIPSSTLLANATDPDNDTLKVVAVKAPQNCTVTLSASGDVTFQGTSNFNGLATFKFTVSDGTVTVDATATVNVTPVNDPPVAVVDMLTTNEDTAITIVAATLAANDTDVEGDTLTVTGAGNGTNGVASFASGSITFTPALHYSGMAAFDYSVSDGQATSTGHVIVSVLHVNHAPVAVNDTITTPEDTAATANVVGNDTDLDVGDTLTITSVTQGSHGTVAFAGGSVTYTPALNYNGNDTFTYTVSDGHGGTSVGTVSVIVTPVNDNPSATTDGLTTPEDTAATVNVVTNDTDVDGDTLIVTSATQGGHGTTLVTGNQTILYTPAPNYNGPDQFNYTISDGHGGSATGKVVVSVTPVDDAPVAVNDTYNTDQISTLTVPAMGVLTNDTDIDSLVITAVLDSQPSCGTVTLNSDGSFTYVPGAGAGSGAGSGANVGRCETDSFTYHAFDGTLPSNIATVTLTIKPVAIDDIYDVTSSSDLFAGQCAAVSKPSGKVGGATAHVGTKQHNATGGAISIATKANKSTAIAFDCGTDGVLNNDFAAAPTAELTVSCPDDGFNDGGVHCALQHGDLYFYANGSFEYDATDVCFGGVESFKYHDLDNGLKSNDATVSIQFTVDTCACNGVGCACNADPCAQDACNPQFCD